MDEGRMCGFCGCFSNDVPRCCCDQGVAEDRLIGTAKAVMLAEVLRLGHDDAIPSRLQPQMVEPAEEWLRHWVQLLLQSPMSTAGPLASLLAAAYWAGHRAGRPETPA